MQYLGVFAGVAAIFAFGAAVFCAAQALTFVQHSMSGRQLVHGWRPRDGALTYFIWSIVGIELTAIGTTLALMLV